ncbi:Group II intron-encoded protein LtrA [Paenibacillus larvae subsp. larvae]|uniref:Group II intron-encoded protein LtrA n=1 Tax=Paenibacillus larvae subsp. larvae TaxID=147375 RepID=A0A2L1U9Y5_9BACL|nr:group II intron reverse transcriptase/maturase [Paenibacillus larvae]AQT85589.1 group II intron reverse transcriptase/maturase [Paenibacillus larvae subsp. pulvifaciens]AQZ47600.1 group II intron reverse transcriptase/maturase [Paenibacillus larvae subsp. pulvifaciens]AVF24969.1 Group II intron-encoded protein LtrA [Paenibacillus larvae subsp. larvae]AVF29732.1 Group II intron-encoded protein LtrA [Paenibacillus larvae subsp. larvae]MBH0341298.1 DNA polymerase [Paenibacillus larvae]
MKAEYRKGCLQRDSVEREEYAGAQSTDIRKGRERDGANDLLERIMDRDNLNKAYKQVKRNHGAPGIDGMTVEAVLPWLRENRDELLQSIREGRYKPSPVRRKEIPKPDGSGVRKLGIPTVVDRIIQQAIAQQLQPLFELLFSDGSYGYRPGRSAQQAIRQVKAYAEQGYGYAVEIDLSKYFDTLNHELLMNLLRKQIHDRRVTDLIKKYLKSGVMENGIRREIEEGSPQGGSLSPLLANIYLNEFDQEMKSRNVRVIRYADDIVVLAKSKRAATRLLESCRTYLEDRLKLKMNVQKSKVVSVVVRKHFKFLGFALGKNRNGVYIRIHRQSLAKAKRKLKELTSRSQGRNARQVMENIKVYIRGWIGYFYVADMKRILQNWNEWLRRRMRMYIWKQWKKPRTKVQNLRKLGVPQWQAYQWGNTRLGYWRIAGSAVLNRSITNERLIQAGYYDFPAQYERLRQLHLNG